jgi:hypothetical protein
VTGFRGVGIAAVRLDLEMHPAEAEHREMEPGKQPRSGHAGNHAEPDPDDQKIRSPGCLRWQP